MMPFVFDKYIYVDLAIVSNLGERELCWRHFLDNLYLGNYSISFKSLFLFDSICKVEPFCNCSGIVTMCRLSRIGYG